MSEHHPCVSNSGDDQPCGRDATHLVELVCGAEHHRTVPLCEVHLTVFQALRLETVDACTACEDTTGVAAPVSVLRIDRWVEGQRVS